MTADVAASMPAQPITWQPRMQAEVLADQLRGLSAWHAARRVVEAEAEAAAGGGRSREARLDLDRLVEVVRRQHEAIVRRTEGQLAASARLPRSTAPVRAVVVHRNDWFKDKLVARLTEGDVEVVARLENGADAVGVVVAEQPDLLVVEDKLPMMSGEEVVRQARQFSPVTIAALQVPHASAVAAGAHVTFTRRTPPVDVARDLCRLVTA